MFTNVYVIVIIVSFCHQATLSKAFQLYDVLLFHSKPIGNGGDVGDKAVNQYFTC